jgi:chemotaxis protein histidine kinase CheA
MNEEELRQMLGKLRADYAAQLPGTVAEMEELWRGIVAAEVPLSQLEKLMRMAHSIAGSGTTFGFPDATRAARAFELNLEALRQLGRSPDAAEQSGAAALLAELKQAAIGP